MGSESGPSRYSFVQGGVSSKGAARQGSTLNMIISECFRGLHCSAGLSYNEAFREMQDRLEVRSRDPGNTMTNYRGRLGFSPSRLVGPPNHNICKSHVSKPTSTDYPEAGRVCRITAYDAMNDRMEPSALRCKNVAASHECITTLVAGGASSCLWNYAKSGIASSRVGGYCYLYEATYPSIGCSLCR